MRYPTGWVVDAHHGTDSDFAERVYRGSPDDLSQTGRRHAI